MSTTTDLLCVDCSERLWVGQSSHLYSAPEYIEALTEFLFKHKSYYNGAQHNIQFVDEHDERLYDPRLNDGKATTRFKLDPVERDKHDA